jgi:hypothetical protein
MTVLIGTSTSCGAPDCTDDAARACDGERGVHRLAGSDAFQRGLDAETIGHLAYGLGGRIPTLLDDIRCTELAGDRLAGRVPGQRDDPLSTEPARGEHRRQSHRAIADDRDRHAWADPGADGRMVAGAGHIGERDDRPQHRVGMARPGDLHERCVAERDADGFSLSTIHPVVAVTAAMDAVRRPSGAAQDARPVAVGEGRDDEIAGLQVADIRADVVHDADEFVADRAQVVR